MDKAKVVEKLNEAISLELGALLQYNQYAHVLLGTACDMGRPVFLHVTTWGSRRMLSLMSELTAPQIAPISKPVRVASSRLVPGPTMTTQAADAGLWWL